MKIGDDDFYEKANDEIATNVLAPIHLTKLFTHLSTLNTVIHLSRTGL